MRKALKNIPKPDENKLAIFYGQNEKRTPQKEVVATVATKTTVDTVATVDMLSTVANRAILKIELNALLTPGQQAVYLSLLRQSHEVGQKVTDWIGYRTLAAESKVSLKTVQRAIEMIAKMDLIKKVDFANTAGKKGSKYEVFLPPKVAMATVDTNDDGGH